MKKIMIVWIIVSMAVLNNSCKKEDVTTDLSGNYTLSAKLDKDLISYSKSNSGNIFCSSYNLTGFTAPPNQVAEYSVNGLTVKIGHRVNPLPSDTISYTDCFQIDLYHKFSTNTDDFALNELELEAFLSRRDIDFLDTTNYYNAEKNTVKEGVVITYYDKNGKVWTTGDFDNKFYSIPYVNPKFDYNSFSFKIIDSKKTNILGGNSEYTYLLKVAFSCDLINSKGELKKLTSGEAEFIYQYRE